MQHQQRGEMNARIKSLFVWTLDNKSINYDPLSQCALPSVFDSVRLVSFNAAVVATIFRRRYHRFDVCPFRHSTEVYRTLNSINWHQAVYL